MLDACGVCDGGQVLHDGLTLGVDLGDDLIVAAWSNRTQLHGSVMLARIRLKISSHALSKQTLKQDYILMRFDLETFEALKYWLKLRNLQIS